MKYILAVMAGVASIATWGAPDSDAQILLAIYLTGFVIVETIEKNRGRA